MNRKKQTSGAFLPIVVAVSLTALAGYYFKKNGADSDEFSRPKGVDGPAGVVLVGTQGVVPKPTLELIDSGTRSPFDKNPQITGAWMRFRVLDDDLPRSEDSSRVDPVTFSAIDDQKQIWRIERVFANGYLYAILQPGYSEPPPKLTLLAWDSGVKTLGSWTFPQAPKPQKVLIKADSQPLLTGSGSRGPDVMPMLAVAPSKPLRPHEKLDLKLTAFENGRLILPVYDFIADNQRVARLSLQNFNGVADNSFCELTVTKSEAVWVQKDVDLSKSHVRLIEGRLILQPVPDRVKLTDDFELCLTPLPDTMPRNGVSRNLLLGLSSDSPAQQLSFSLQSAESELHDLRVRLINKFPVEAEVHILNNPPSAKEATGEIYEGVVPLRFHVEGWIYRKGSTSKVVLPIKWTKRAMASGSSMGISAAPNGLPVKRIRPRPYTSSQK